MKRHPFTKVARTVALALCAALLASPFLHGAEGLPREKGAIYLEDFFEQPYRLRVLADAPIYFNADLGRFLGTLRRGQLVELQAVNDGRGRLRIKGLAKQGQVVGWVEAKNLTALDPAFIAGLRRSAERREIVTSLVANGEVALGMTMDEVTTSLGAPVRKSSHADVQGILETWEYVHYIQVPRLVSGYDSVGRFGQSVVYERVPSGKFAVVFGNGLVNAVDRTAGNLAAATTTAPVKSVPPPVGISLGGRSL